MTGTRRGWSMPDEDARSMLARIDEKIRSSDIDLRHRDALVRLRAMLEVDLCAASEAGDVELMSDRSGSSADAER